MNDLVRAEDLPNNSGVGDSIKKFRKQAKITQEQLAQSTDLSTMSVRRYESGDRTPNLDHLRKISATLNMPLGQLLKEGGKGMKKSHEQIKRKCGEIESFIHNMDFSEDIAEINKKNGVRKGTVFTISLNNGRYTHSGIVETEEQGKLISRVVAFANENDVKKYNLEIQQLADELEELVREIREDK